MASGQDKNGLFKVLLTHGYAYDAISQEMQFEPTVPLDELVNPFRSEPQIHSSSNRSIAGKSLPKDNLFIPNSEKLGSDNFSIYKVEDYRSRFAMLSLALGSLTFISHPFLASQAKKRCVYIKKLANCYASGPSPRSSPLQPALPRLSVPTPIQA